MKVHYVPQGVESDKVSMMSGMAISAAERVFIIRNSNAKLKQTEVSADSCAKSIKNEIGQSQIFQQFMEVCEDEKKVDFFNFMDCLGKFDKWIGEDVRAGDRVSVNISTGNKIVSSALLIAALKHRAEVYYFVPGDILPKGRAGVPFAESAQMERVVFTGFPMQYMQGVSCTLLRTLEEMENNGNQWPSLTEIILKLHPEIEQTKDTQKRTSIMKSEREKLSDDVDMLKEWGYVQKVTAPRRGTTVRLTPAGKDALSYFKR